MITFRRVALWLGLLVAFGAASFSAPAQTPALLHTALQKLQADENRWAFTQSTHEFDRKGKPKEGPTIERFDPSQPYAQQWTLLQYEGHKPTAREERSWRKRKDKEMKRREEKSLGEIMDFERAVESSREGGRVIFEVPLLPGASKRLPAEKFVVHMTVDATSETLQAFDLRTREAFRTLGVAKITNIEISAEFATVDPQYAPQPKHIIAQGAGRILFFPVGGAVEIDWSDFKRVKPYDERFEVTVGDLKAFGF